MALTNTLVTQIKIEKIWIQVDLALVHNFHSIVIVLFHDEIHDPRAVHVFGGISREIGRASCRERVCMLV